MESVEEEAATWAWALLPNQAQEPEDKAPCGLAGAVLLSGPAWLICNDQRLQSGFLSAPSVNAQLESLSRSSGTTKGQNIDF